MDYNRSIIDFAAKDTFLPIKEILKIFFKSYFVLFV